jgi:hypothetical protein
MLCMAGPRRLAWLAAAWGLASVALGASWDLQAGKVDSPAFFLTTVKGETLAGPLLSLGADGAVEMAGEKSSPIKSGQWLTLRRAKVPLPAHPRGPQIVLTSGDRIPLAAQAAVKIVDNELHFQPHDALRVSKAIVAVPLSRVVLVWLGGPDETEEPALLLRKLLDATRGKDLVLKRNGDKVEGDVVALDSASGCRVDVVKKHVEMPWVSVGAVAFSTELLARKPPAGVYYHLVLANGGRLSLLSPQLSNGAETLKAKTLFGAAVEVPLEQLVAVEVRNGSAVYLSDLKPRKFEHTPFAGTSWPLVVNGSATGRELRLGGSTFDTGLGMHAESRVVYDLDAQFRWFEAQVALDPEYGKKGRVRIRVLVDGKEKDIGWNTPLTATDGALALRVEISQGRELTLEVLFGGYGDVQAHVNWVDARVIR